MLSSPYSLDRGDIVTDGVMALLLESGSAGLSLRKLADRQGCSVGSLTNRWGTRGRILHIAVNYFRRRWNQHMEGLSRSEGLLALLPATREEVEDCHVWFAFCDLAKTDATIAECVAGQREDERDFVRFLAGSAADHATVDTLVALVDGLRLALCAPEPMSVETARAVLAAELTQKSSALAGSSRIPATSARNCEPF